MNTFYPLKNILPSTAFELSSNVGSNLSLPGHIEWDLNSMRNEEVINAKFKMLDAVVIRYKRKSPTEKMDDSLCSGMFKSGSAIIFDFINQDQSSAWNSTNILQWLEGRVPGLYTHTENFVSVAFIGNAQVAICVDEFPVEPSYLNGFPIHDIAMIKVIPNLFNENGFGQSVSAIAIYTKRRNMHSINSKGYFDFLIL